MSEQIQELFSTELTKYLQSAAFQETMSQTLKSVEAATKPLKEKINYLESQLFLIR